MVFESASARFRLSELGLLLALGCAPDAAPPSAPVRRAEQPQPVASAGQEHESDAQLAREAVDIALREITRVRGLVPLHPVKSRVVDRHELVAVVRARMDQDMPPHVAEGTECLLLALGVVPLSFDYRASLLTLLGSQLAGVYDPKSKTMLLASDLSVDELHATLAHELVHALQDQHFDLGSRLEYREGEGDRQTALHALAEGDATSAMADQMLAGRGMNALDLSDAQLSESMRSSLEEAEGTQDVPRVIKRALISPYADGIALVNWARRRGGWPEVDRLWRDPPVSTEQLLHPEKWLAQENPEPVPVPVADGPGMQVTYQDVMGELSLQLVFEQWMESSAARRAAADWSGDRLAVLQEGERRAVVWHVRYDDPAAARRGLVGFGAGVVAAAEQEREAGPEDEEASAWWAAASPTVVDAARAFRAVESGQACQLRSPRGPFAVLVQGREVVLVAGPYVGAPPRQGDGDCSTALAWAARVAVPG